MTTYTLAAIDVSGIQDYVFGSNKLQHIIGASELVHRATHDWVRDALPMPDNLHNLRNVQGLADSYTDDPIEDSKLKAEVLYLGGGNALILFTHPSDANAFAEKLSRKVLTDAPGLRLMIKLEPIKWTTSQDTNLAGDVRRVLDAALRQKKDEPQPSGDLLGLGVTADCQFTGLPAVDLDKDGRRISAETKTKTQDKLLNAARQRLRREASLGDRDFVTDFNDFGEPGEASYIAVVHADGNGMGKRFQDLPKKILPNREYIRQARELSCAVNSAGQSAMEQVIDVITESMKKDADFVDVVLNKDRTKLRFRPLVFGGDDTTFVCDGRIGLSLAAAYLQAFGEQPMPGDGATARAGVAIVNTHYPFARAYKLAEALAKSAKDYRTELEANVATLDWHFGINGQVESLKTTRGRDYTVKEGSLLMRPVRLRAQANEWRSWDTFETLVTTLQDDPDLNERRNVLKALRETLRAGKEATSAFCHVRQISLPALSEHANAHESGWLERQCVYYDAIEAMDLFVRLPVSVADLAQQHNGVKA